MCVCVCACVCAFNSRELFTRFPEGPGLPGPPVVPREPYEETDTVRNIMACKKA